MVNYIESIKEEQHLYEYLVLNPFWYKELDRDISQYKLFKQEADIHYKKTTYDKVTGIVENIEFISGLISSF